MSSHNDLIDLCVIDPFDDDYNNNNENISPNKNVSVSTKHHQNTTEKTNSKVSTLKNSHTLDKFICNNNKRHSITSTITQHINKKHKNVTTTSNNSKSEQLYLDVGQNHIGSITCNICDMLYYIGQSDDEKLHKLTCKKYIEGIVYNRYKNDNIVNEIDNKTYIVMITYNTLYGNNSNKQQHDKIYEIIEFINKQLGGTSDTDVNDKLLDCNQSILLYVHNKRIHGICIVQHNITAYNMSVTMSVNKNNITNTSEYICNLSTMLQPCILGIDKIWVHSSYRKQHIASQLVDTARDCIEYGITISINQVAFSQPTDSGKIFAMKYCNSNNILTYS